MINLNSLDEKLNTSLDGMLELRHQMTKMDQLPVMDKDKVHDNYHTYERLVRDARHDIQKHLNVLRQKESDQTGGARVKVQASEFEQKHEENPRHRDHYKYFSDDLSKKDKKRNWKEGRRQETSRGSEEGIQGKTSQGTSR